jgi:hypothetical protein
MFHHDNTERQAASDKQAKQPPTVRVTVCEKNMEEELFVTVFIGSCTRYISEDNG